MDDDSNIKTTCGQSVHALLNKERLNQAKQVHLVNHGRMCAR